MKSYKAICPSCGDDNLYVTPNNGMAYCFNPSCHYTEFNGKATIKKRVRSDFVPEIRGLYKELTTYYHSCIDNKARTFLYLRGFNDSTIQNLSIGYCPHGKLPIYRDPIAREAGLVDKHGNAFLGGRIVFPYFKDAETVTDIRGRTIEDDDVKYKSPFNDAVYRGAIFPYNYHLHTGKRIILTEGEIKAGIAYQYGFPTLALPGISSWRTGLLQEDDQEYIIVFDNESKPNVQREVILAIRKAAQYLIDPKIAVLPLMGKKKTEIDTFINEHGPHVFKGIIDNALNYKQWDELQAF